MRRRTTRVCLALACAWLMVLAVRAAEPVHRYDLPAGNAADVLREFARVSNLQLVFPERIVRGVRTPELRGELTVRDALGRLLADTGLEAVRDGFTGAYAVRRTPPRAPAVEAPEIPAPLPSTPEDALALPPMEMDPVRIVQRRDFGVTTQSLLRADPVAPAYHHIATRADIERSGVTSMAEFVALLPGYSGEGAEALQATADFTFLGGANVYSGSFLKLRGWDAQHTAVLLNGRALPVSPESRGPDLSRIPLAAVERIELLPFAGSAPYGDGAVGGALNIVLRKDFAGRSFSLQLGESTRGGGREVFFTWIEGLASADGRTRATIIGDYQHRGALRLGERDFLARAIERLPPERLLPGGGRFGPDTRALLQAQLAGSRVVFSVAASEVDLGIPGRRGAQFAIAPAGRNAAQLEPGDFSETDPAAVTGQRQKRVVLRRPTETFNLNVQLEHAVRPDAFELYGEIGYARADERFSAPDAIESLFLSAADPRNPFRDDVTPGFVGRNVTLHFDPVDLPDARFWQVRDSARAVFGARGTPSRTWRWAFDSFVDVSRSRASVDSYGESLNELLRRWAPWTSEVYSLIYDPLADHRTAPVSVEMRERFLARRSWLDFRSRMAGADLRVSGEPWELPAGPVRVALGAEYAWQRQTTRQQTEASRDLHLITGALEHYERLTELRTADDRDHRVGGVAEAIVPLFRKGKTRLPLHSGELNLATRLGLRSDIDRPASSSLAAIKIAPRPSWALRATFSQGHATPASALVSGAVTETSTSTQIVDPQRGGTTQVYPLAIVRGGSRALRAETSQARVFGLLVTPAALPGFSLSIDAWSIAMRDRLRVPTVQEIVTHAEYFPGKIERGEPLAWEKLLGWEGPVTRVDVRPVHVTRLKAEGFDVAFRYRLPATRTGTWMLNGQLEIVRRYDEQFLPVTPVVDKVDVVTDGGIDGFMESAVVSPRGRATLAWHRGGWFGSLAASYTPPYHTDSTTPVAALPGATGLDGERIGSSTRWDLQLGYDVREGRGSGGPHARRNWISDTTWTLGVRNILDAPPPYRSDGRSFYSRFDDPRMRFVYVRVQWRR